MNSPFTPEQIFELRKSLDDKTVKHRQGGGGSDLKYLAGYQVIDTANRIIGEGNWGYDLLGVELNNVIGENGELAGSYYSARVKVTVKDCIPITDEGVCAIQNSRNPRAMVDAHDMARKGAITDAMKRAFRCYGNQFGNPLYDKDYGNTPATENKPQQPATQATGRPVTPSQPATVNRTAQPAPAPIAAPARPVTPIQTPAATGELATDQQIQAIARMAGRKGVDDIQLNDRLTELYGVELKSLSRSDASHFIKVFQEAAK